MRQLETDDILKAVRLVKRNKLVKHIKKIVAEEKTLLETGEYDNVNEFGMSLAMELISDEKLKGPLYTFLKDIFEVDNVSKLPPGQLIDNLTILFTENDIMDFFTKAVNLLTMMSK